MYCGLSVCKLTLLSEQLVHCVSVLNCYKRILVLRPWQEILPAGILFGEFWFERRCV
jgi:hypothetical protein